jgi:hypothetical protein
MKMKRGFCMGLKHYKTKNGTYLHAIRGEGKCTEARHVEALNRRLEMKLVDVDVLQNEPGDHPPVLSQSDAKKLIG